MRTDSNMENIKFLLDSMDLNETYMDDPRYYVPVFEITWQCASVMKCQQKSRTQNCKLRI